MSDQRHTSDSGPDEPLQNTSNSAKAQIKRIRSRRKERTVEELTEGVLSGNRTLLSRAITLVESTHPEHQEKAQKVLENCLPSSGNSVRIGITGVPGVGKSTFIESLGNHILAQGRTLAVLAIDPSSTVSHGSILGDKTRMETLATHPDAFIRPSPTGGSLGGVARKTRESMLLCEAAGFDTIFIETVGVGQSEISVHSMVDFFLLLMLAGAGDELQGIKRGIVEMADALVINKADGENKRKAQRAAADYQRALHLFPAAESGWTPEVKVCSALTERGIPRVWEMVEEYLALTKENGYFEKQRNEQVRYWLFEAIQEQLKQDFYSDPAVKKKLAEVEQQVVEEKLSPFHAARALMKIYEP